jgi:large subunit ribosomal protein L25
MHSVAIVAQSRSNTGKGAARSLRREGKVPAVIYGHGREPMALAVEAKAFGKVLDIIGGEAALLDVAIDGAAPVKALVREVQRNPVRRSDVIHIDFYAVVAGEPIVVDVPVHIVGVADGVRNQGGVLDHHLHRISIRVLPANIPEHIDIDVTHLNVGDAIHVRDIPALPAGEFMMDGDVSVASIIASRAEVSVATETSAEDEPEVIKKGKADEAETDGE